MYRRYVLGPAVIRSISEHVAQVDVTSPMHGPLMWGTLPLYSTNKGRRHRDYTICGATCPRTCCRAYNIEQCITNTGDVHTTITKFDIINDIQVQLLVFAARGIASVDEVLDLPKAMKRRFYVSVRVMSSVGLSIYYDTYVNEPSVSDLHYGKKDILHGMDARTILCLKYMQSACIDSTEVFGEGLAVMNRAIMQNVRDRRVSYWPYVPL